MQQVLSHPIGYALLCRTGMNDVKGVKESLFYIQSTERHTEGRKDISFLKKS